MSLGWQSEGGKGLFLTGSVFGYSIKIASFEYRDTRLYTILYYTIPCPGALQVAYVMPATISGCQYPCHELVNIIVIKVVLL